MKQFILFAQAVILSFLVLPLPLSAQESETTFPNYVVIGAFAHQENAIQFTDEAKRNNHPARFEMNPNRNLYYVYVLTTNDRAYAREEALRLRAETKYFDTWVYSGVFGNVEVATLNSGGQQDFNPATGQPIQSVTGQPAQKVSVKRESSSVSQEPRSTAQTGAEPARVNQQSIDDNKIAQGDVVATAGPARETVTSTNIRQERTEASKRDNANYEVVRVSQKATNTPQAIDGTSLEPSNTPQPIDGNSQEADRAKPTDVVVNTAAPVRQSTEPLTSEEVVGKDFYFHLYRADNHKTIPGEVDAIDFEKSRKMGTYPANEGVKVMMAGGKMKHISFVCQVFGYRKQQQEFDPDNLSEQLYLDDNSNVVVPFELVRLQKGDIAIMYNVFFFKDAAVMRPESRYEVNNLLDLLVENPTYNIVIHGHTNGNASGKIIRMGEPGNFYSLTGTKQAFGSARQLSEDRAAVIREFLISSGISADRMQVKAWGGKKPIHDKHSARAQENVRVEIEILSE